MKLFDGFARAIELAEARGMGVAVERGLRVSKGQRRLPLLNWLCGQGGKLALVPEQE
jgi:hypothetical protein